MSIQERRLEMGWSQEQLAQHSGLSVRTIQRIEGGRRAGLESLKCLAAVFETTVSLLMQEQTMADTSTPTTSSPVADEVEREAVEYVQNLRAFHMHWIAFAIIMPALYLMNMSISPDVRWFEWVGMAWGGALILHVAVIFGLFNLFGAKWEQKEFRKRMNDRH